MEKQEEDIQILQQQILVLSKRVESLESILIDISVFQRKSTYLYLTDLLKALKKHELIKETPKQGIYKIIYKKQDNRKINKTTK